MTEITFRALHAEDAACLRLMLYHAIYVPPGDVPPPLTIVDQPDIARYIVDFGQRAGDSGVLALADGVCIGAAWVRLMEGYGFIAADVPELSIALVPEYRGQGIGSQLLDRVLAALRSEFTHISLSVSLDNPAKRLYERIGFQEWAINAGTATMRLTLPPAAE